ncbi:Protease 3 precursor [Thalassovita gelatinovora]|uniref:Protease 3 n=1 Tax=Thalassovita gelatinovora TaxID=53501 RepID=A0A0P1F5X8_THAGE|nr:pitrilysin family protein [Thalassovita gelatinovora]QIZ80864.1 insulinase family protein [Thalassovita gelatinovora]CUH63312.1 Protease 3 precursor [Thalassovita gelatinovora]SEQ65028.1 zinc protease [Thalassovita gelatinovora]
MIRFVLGFAAFIATSLPALADDQVSNFTLNNGMEVVVIEDHRAPVVVQMVWYRAGSADEPVGQSGVAHFLEHLLFKGTETLEPGEFSATVAKNGGRDNAFTSYDYTAYHQRVAADRLELMMQMESDRMVNLRLTETEIATERDVILEERNMRTENNPSALFREQKSAVQYLNHRYGVPVIGWRHEMEDLSLADALSFYGTYYSPNNAILVVAGDVDPEEVRTLATKYYGAIPANPDLPDTRYRSQEPPQTAERRLTYRDARVAQPYVSRSYLAPERDHGAQEKAAALTVLAEILGGGQTSVLAEKLQFESQTAVYVGAYYGGTSLDDTTFDLVVVPAPGVSLQQAEDAMDQTLAEFLETGIDTEQLTRIKTQIRASEIYARDDVEGLANRYGRALTQGLTVKDVQEWPDILQAVSADDIVAAAKDVLDRRQSVTGWMMAEEVTQ